MKIFKNNYKQPILFTPGPVNLDKRVRNAAISKDLFHRQKEFIDILINVKQKLLNISGKKKSNVSILHGSGSLAVESALQTLVEGKVFIINNGYYCERIKKSLQNKKNVIVKSLDLKTGEYPDLDLIKKIIDKTTFDWICIVHHETTTGILNPLKKICDLVQNKSTRIFVDAVSSFGIHPIDKRVSVICANSNKCLESIPGAAIVIWDKKIKISKNIIPYIDVSKYIENKIPCTLNTNAIIALDKALEIYSTENRPKRYENLSSYIREKGSLHFNLFLKKNYSNVLTCFSIPNGKSFEICKLAHKYNLILYPSKNITQFRICNLGVKINYKTIDFLFEKIGDQ